MSNICVVLVIEGKYRENSRKKIYTYRNNGWEKKQFGEMKFTNSRSSENI